METDVLIAGGGVAGLTAGLFSARLGLNTRLLTGEQNMGHLVGVGVIEDFPGFPEGVPGYELCPMLQEQAMQAGADIRMGTVSAFGRRGEDWALATTEGEMVAGAVIIATGSSLRVLGVPGEDRLRGRGVSDCATCDGPLYRGKVVAVVGSGDSALLEALELVKHVDSVLLFVHGTSLTGQAAYAKRVLAHPSIKVHYEAAVEQILGDSTVESLDVRYSRDSEVVNVPVSGIFAYVGLKPRTEIVSGVIDLDQEGRIPTDPGLRTQAPGVFAAGDVRTGSSSQAVAAAGDGATAAVFAHEYLEQGRTWPSSSERAMSDVDR